MRYVLQIIADLGIGGAEKVACDIGLYAARADYETHYIVFKDTTGEYEKELTGNGSKVFHWPSPSKHYLQYVRALKSLIRENQYDIVHAHTMFNIGWTMLAAKQCGVPIRIAHAHSALRTKGSIRKTVYEHCMRRMILDNATELVACGDAAGIRLYGKEAYEKSGVCILNGIDIAAFAYRTEAGKRIRNELGLRESFVIGHVGHLAEVKNQSFLIKLMPEIRKRRPDARLLLLGEGEDRSMLEALIRKMGLEGVVLLTGNVPNVPDYLSAMDVFAFPSLYEGMPLSILEVQANGLPCVLSTGVPKDVYLTDLVRSLPLDKPDEWIDAICCARRNEPEKYADELKAKGFDTETVMQKFMELYKKA